MVTVVLALTIGSAGIPVQGWTPAITGPVKISGDDALARSDLVSAGSGTPDDPYVIENHHFVVWQYGLWIHNVTAHLDIRNNTFLGWTNSLGAAINVTSSQNLAIVDNRITTTLKGIGLLDSSDVLISGNHQSSPTLIASRGIVIERAARISIVQNDISVAEAGLEIVAADNLTISENRFASSNPGANGVQLWSEVVDSRIMGNVIIGPGTGVGIVIIDSSRLNVSHNEISDWTNAVHGYQRNADNPYGNITLLQNIFNDNHMALVYHICDHCHVLGNTFADNGLALDLTSGGRIECNRFLDNEVAIHASSGEVLRNNTFERNGLDLKNRDQPVDLRWNWWGSVAGPRPASVQGPATYDPWLVAPPSC